MTVCCPALLISAPASGQGKTTVTAALARYHRNQGKKVRVFKTGPDFLDPMILEQASGNPVYQLDLWMVGKAASRRLLYDAAKDADLILIEGVMGLFDGNPSSADLAEFFSIPVLAVIDASAMAQTFSAIAYGLRNFRNSLPFAGVIANNVASAGHADMLAHEFPEKINFYGALQRNADIKLPERHLGLVQANEVKQIDTILDEAAEAIASTRLSELPDVVEFSPVDMQQAKPLLQGIRIAVARDDAFSFIYPANIDLLRQLGAELVFFSPLEDTALPKADALWLPGGYPELYLTELESNNEILESIRQHHKNNKPVLAECGGMLYLMQTLTDKEGHKANMAGLLVGDAIMQKRLMGLGMQKALLKEGELSGHTFHHSRLETDMQAEEYGQKQYDNSQGEAIYRNGQLVASYIHLYFPSNPEAVAKLFSPGLCHD